MKPVVSHASEPHHQTLTPLHAPTTTLDRSLSHPPTPSASNTVATALAGLALFGERLKPQVCRIAIAVACSFAPRQHRKPSRSGNISVPNAVDGGRGAYHSRCCIRNLWRTCRRRGTDGAESTKPTTTTTTKSIPRHQGRVSLGSDQRHRSHGQEHTITPTQHKISIGFKEVAFRGLLF